MRVIKRTSLNLDQTLLADARAALGTDGATATVHAALSEIVRQQRIQRLLNRDMSMTDAEFEAFRREAWGD